MSGIPGSESHTQQALGIIVMGPLGSPVIKFQAKEVKEKASFSGPLF